MVGRRNSLFYLLHNNYMSSFNRERSRVRVMVFNATFNNISVISWQLVLFVGETGVPGENQ